MKIIKNEKLIARNGKIANYLALGELGIFIVYAYFTVKALFDPKSLLNSNPALLFGLLIVIFILVQISSYLGPRFGKSPRLDEQLDASLKGLHSDFHLYHYASPISHLLIGPSGVWAILLYYQQGKVEFVKNRWKLSGGKITQKYLRIFGFDRLGRPETDAASEVNSVKKFFSKKLDESAIPEIKPVLVFTHDEVEVEAGDSPIAAMKLKQLKEFMRQGGKNRVLSSEQIRALTEALGS